MSSNNRIFYACQAVAISRMGDVTIDGDNLIHGLQSIGVTTNFNLEQAFELGQIEIYENIEGLPDVEVTLEKVLDGYPLMYHMASTGVVGTTASGLVARSKERCDLRLGIYSEASDNVASDNSSNTSIAGAPEVEVYCSGMYISSVSYSIPVDGNATESVTLVGNNKKWLTASDVKITDSSVSTFNGFDEPRALTGSGGIQRREDVLLASSILPRAIRGVKQNTSLGNAVVNAGTDNTPLVHVQSVTVSTDFGREDILELGRKAPYYRAANFPIEVTCEIEAITVSGDFVSAVEEGDPLVFANDPKALGNNTSNETIFLMLRGGYSFDLGNKNRLSSVSYGGGDAGGGNVSCTYSYSTFNTLDVRGIYQTAGGNTWAGLNPGY